MKLEKSKKITVFLFLIVIVFFINTSFGQSVGQPKVFNFKETQFLKDIWDIKQMPNGILILAGLDGIYEYSNAQIKPIFSYTGANFLSIDIDENGRIYYGTKNEIGYLYINQDKFENKIISSDSIIADVWRTFVNNGYVYFFINKRDVGIYDGKNLRIINSIPKFRFIRGFKVKNTIYAVSNNSIGRFINDNFYILQENFKAAEQDIRVLLPYDEDHFLVGTKMGNFYIFDKTFSVGKPLVLENQDFIKNARVYYGTTLYDSLFVIGTLTKGIIVFNKQGKTKFIIDDKHGLRSATVIYLYIDKNNNIWAGSIGGISKICTSNHLLVLGKFNKLSGKILRFSLEKNKILVFTNTGSYYLDLSEKDYFKRNTFKVLNKNLLYGTSLIKLEHNNKTYYATGSYEYLFLFSEDFKIVDSLPKRVTKTFDFKKDYFFISTSSGFMLYKIEDAGNKPKLKFITSVHGVKNINEIKVLSDSQIIINSLMGLFYLKFKDNSYKKYTLSLIYDYSNQTQKLYNRTFFYKNNIYFIDAEQNAFKIVKNKDSISLFRLNKLPFDIKLKQNEILLDFLTTPTSLYLLTNTKILKINTKTNKTDSINFRCILFDLDYDFSKYLYLYNNKLLLKGIKYLIALDTNFSIYKNNYFPNIVLESVIFEGKKYLFLKPVSNKIDLFSHKLAPGTMMKLTFVYPFFTGEKLIKYSYKFDNDKDWSEWTDENYITFVKLRGGNHSLHVRVKNIYGQIRECTIDYKVKYIWWKSPAAILVYLLILLFAGYLVNKWRIRKIEKEKKLLEELVQKRTAILKEQNKKLQELTEELEKQKNALKEETRRLKLLTEELQLLSLVAKHTANSVVILDKNKTIEWWNKGFSNLFKEKLEMMKNLPFKEKIKKIRPDIIKAIESSGEEVKKSIVYTNHEKIGDKEIWYKTIISPIIDDEGNITKYVVVDIDITDIKKAEAEIKKQKKLLEEQAEELRNANLLLLQQKDEIELKNYEITSSIEYAKRIQEALFPQKIFLQSVFSDYFVFYKPKAIVSGDFYWIEYRKNMILMAVGDSTGHGVPGAFMSILGISLLKDVIYNSNLVSPDEILFELREKIIYSLHQRSDKTYTKDGIDLSFVVFYENEQKFVFAGANSSIIIMRANGEQEILKGDKMPIGIHERVGDPFTNISGTFAEGDKFYFYSDGFADQFGGEKNKKYSFRQFKEFIAMIARFSMDKQEQLINDEFRRWKGDNEQTDDIIVFGVQII